jgi:hypothetical protein
VAVPQKQATAIVNVARVIAPVDSILSLRCGDQKQQNLLGEVLGNHR